MSPPNGDEDLVEDGEDFDVDDFDLEACSAPVGGELSTIYSPLIALEIIVVAFIAVASLMMFSCKFTRKQY